MNKKKILIAILSCLIAISMFFIGVVNSNASIIYDNNSLKNNISSVKLYNNSNTLVYGGNDSALNTFNALCIDNNSIHTYLLTEQYYNQVKIYTGNFGSGWYFILDFKNKLYSNDYSIVFNARYDNNGVGPYDNINVYITFDDSSSVYKSINRNVGETTAIFDYDYFTTNNKLEKTIKSIRFNIPYITSIDIFNNNTNLSYDIGYQNGIDSVTNTPNAYNLYSYEQYQYSYNTGYQDGLDTDTSTSYNNGYSTGYTDGYNYGYAQSYASGVNRVVNFNQLVKNGNFNGNSDWTLQNITTFTDNTAIITTDSTELLTFLQYTSTTLGHIYLVSFEVKTDTTPSNINEIRLRYPFVSDYFSATDEYRKISFIAISTSSDYIGIQFRLRNATTSSLFIKNFMLFDLTQIYGSGNEPTTYTQFYEDFPSVYYPTTNSELVNIDFENGYNKGVQDMNVVVREKQELLNKAVTGDLTFTNMFTSIFDVPVQTITGLLNFEFLGVNLLDFFLSIFTICIIIAVLKLIL